MYIDVKLNNKKTRILVESKYNVNLKNELKAAGQDGTDVIGL